MSNSVLTVKSVSAVKSQVFVVKSQHGLYLNKQQEWVDGADNQSLYRTRHRDEAINTVFEVSSRDISLRAEVIVCALDAKDHPALATAATASAATIAMVDDLALEDVPAVEEEPSAEAEPALTTDELAAENAATPTANAAS